METLLYLRLFGNAAGKSFLNIAHRSNDYGPGIVLVPVMVSQMTAWQSHWALIFLEAPWINLSSFKFGSKRGTAELEVRVYTEGTKLPFSHRAPLILQLRKYPFPWEMCVHISPVHHKDNHMQQNKNFLYFFLQFIYLKETEVFSDGSLLSFALR